MEVKSQFWRDGWLPMISIPKLIFIFIVEELPDNGVVPLGYKWAESSFKSLGLFIN